MIFVLKKNWSLLPVHAERFPAAFRTQARVRGHDDPVGLAEVHELGLLQVQVDFHLQVVWLHLARVQYPLQLFDVKIGHTDRFDPAVGHLFLHHLETVTLNFKPRLKPVESVHVQKACLAFFHSFRRDNVTVITYSRSQFLDELYRIYNWNARRKCQIPVKTRQCNKSILVFLKIYKN